MERAVRVPGRGLAAARLRPERNSFSDTRPLPAKSFKPHAPYSLSGAPFSGHIMTAIDRKPRSRSHPACGRFSRVSSTDLNKGEARNALARAVCFHRLGRLRDRAAAAQQYRAIGLALVTAAIVLWNTVYLGRALDELHRSSEIVPDPLLDHLAPVGCQHINLTGDYLWDADSGLGPDGFRSLRTPVPNLRSALVP